MRKNIKTTEAIFPMPVLLIATYNEDGTVNVMNAAWGTMVDREIVALNLDETHCTVKNIRKRKGFTVAIADAAHVAEADYFGVVSGNDIPDKLSATGLKAVRSEFVDAPVLTDFPIVMECEYLDYQEKTYEFGLGVIGQVLNVSVDESAMKGDKVDIDAVGAIAFDPYTHGYYKVGGRVGEAFRDGLKFRK